MLGLRVLGLALATALLGIAPSVAEAQTTERLGAHVELGAGAMLPDYQTDDLDYGLALLGAVRPSFLIAEPLRAQLALAWWAFPSDAGAGQQLTVGGGLRVDPSVGDVGRFFLDANVGVGFTGDLERLAFDTGAGFELALPGEMLFAGPFVRYGHLFASDADHPSDAQYLVAGVSASWQMPRRVQPTPMGDVDGDGVLDADDLCVDVPAGDHPDPERPGCPMGDQDGDGVVDREDVCPTVPAGDHPDPDRPGCPAPDSDSDGVLDHADACPTTPAGEHPDPDAPGCPDADSDADGVLDHSDTCPEQHHGLHPDPERPGCPAPDRDRDTVPDATDACPDEPGAPHPDPERNGCPSLVVIEEGRLRITRPVFFAFNRDRILPRSRPVLQAVADALVATPSIRRVSIEGHTDDVGTEEYNVDLSRRRAANVRAWLIQHGIEAERLESVGYGEGCPVVEATTPDARATNRRVDFRIVDPPLSPPNECGAPPAVAEER